MANSLLDEIGMVDVDGDGFRELPNGDRIVLNLQFATQGIAGEVVELIGQHWSDVGIQTTVKEVTPDEYRSAQSSNQLDVGVWLKSQPLPVHLGTNSYWAPPFDGYFDLRTGMLWAEYIDSEGASGVAPPAWVAEMREDVNAFQAAAIGSEEQNALGLKLAQKMVDEMLFIGTVKAPAPIYHRNALKNVPEFRTWSYEYYRTYPYRAAQWHLAE
jgi:peptide/nickel transport system substrate-binding protein